MIAMHRLPALLASAALALAACVGSAGAQTPAAAKPLTVVELFQSQGCSSCPPAEANLNALAGRPGILALSYGVTYWDGLGWKDTFAQQAFTDRQYDYAHYHRHHGVWTPQVYIDGGNDLVGSDRAQLDQAVAGAGMQGPPLSWAGGRLLVGAGKPAARCDVWLVRYDPRTLDVAIRGGENRGRTLPHRNVVRQLIHLGTWDGGAQAFNLPASSGSGLSTAALVQIARGGPILGASLAP